MIEALIKEIGGDNKLIDFRLIDGTEDLEYFYENGYTDREEVEQSYTGDWYIAGYIPEKSIAIKQNEVRQIRNVYLQEYDFTQLTDAPFNEQEKEIYANYRQYLRDYTLIDNWWEQNPLTYEEWATNNNN